mgnify:CR=1 FL=1
MKTKLVILLASLLFCAGINAQAVATNGGTTKTLIVYFSWGGNTQHVAEHIASLTGGTLFRIEPEKPYPAEYTPCTEVAKAERKPMLGLPSNPKWITGTNTTPYSSAVQSGGGRPR